MKDYIVGTSSNFDEEVLKAKVPVVVDFWAEWCGPCRLISPIIEELATKYKGNAKMVKVNVDENAEVSSKFGIQSIPTVLFFKDGRNVDTVIGAVPASLLEEKLKKYI